MADNKQHDTRTTRRPDCVTEIRMGNSVLVVSGYFKKDTTTTAADKMARVLEAEAAATTGADLSGVNRGMEKAAMPGSMTAGTKIGSALAILNLILYKIICNFKGFYSSLCQCAFVIYNARNYPLIQMFLLFLLACAELKSICLLAAVNSSIVYFMFSPLTSDFFVKSEYDHGVMNFSTANMGRQPIP